MINNKFLFFKTQSGFEEALRNNIIQRDSIAFIQNPARIWTHDTYFIQEGGSQMQLKTINGQSLIGEGDIEVAAAQSGPDHVFMTLSQYNALGQYDENTIYFILGGEAGSDENWTFGDQFPITFTGTWAFGGTFPIILK